MMYHLNQYILIFIMMLSPAILGAQHHYDFNWYIGYGYNLQDPLIDVAHFNFKSGFNLSIDTVGLKMSGQNVTMSNAEGELLFYSNGCEIRNAQHQVIPGSDPLLPGENDDIFCSASLAAMVHAQTMLSIPFEVHPDTTLYYIYQRRDTFGNINGIEDLYGEFREHLISDHNGELTLQYKDSIVTGNYNYTGFFDAVKHANNEDWWLIYPFHSQNGLESVLITESGSRSGMGSVTSNYSEPKISRYGRSSGQLDANLKGTRLAMFLDNSEFFYMSFDRQLGKINFLSRDTLPIPDAFTTRGTQFSPNGRFIYLSVDSFLYQLDTESHNFPKDPELIATTYKDHPSGRKDDFSLMQLGPDCKIYINTFSNSDFYHVIHRPNEKGQACMVEVRDIRLKTLNDRTIPLFPNYRLGTPEENWCDSIFDDTTSSSYQFQEPQKRWQIWPNPTDEYVKIAHEDGNFGLESVEIYTFQGQMVRERSFEALSVTYEMNVSGLPKGIYLVKVLPKVGFEEWHRVVVQ